SAFLFFSATLNPLLAEESMLFGAKGGVPIMDPFVLTNDNAIANNYTFETKRFIGGPFFQMNLPWHVGFEADALYRRLHYESNPVQHTACFNGCEFMGISADGETDAPRSLPSPLWRHRRVFCACQRQNGFFQCGIAEQGASGTRENVEHGWACGRWYRHTPRQVSLSARDSLHALGHTDLCFWKWFVQFQSKFDRFPDRSRVWKVIIM